MCTCELYNIGITSTKEEPGLVSGGKGWFRLVSGWEGLVSAGFRVGRTGFGWFRLVPLFSNYHWRRQMLLLNRMTKKMQ